MGNRKSAHFGESTDISDVFQDYSNLLELLVSPKHLCTYCLMGLDDDDDDDDNNNNNNKQPTPGPS